MVSHRLRLDIEFLALVGGAMSLSYFLAYYTDFMVSHVLFTALISSLFFLIGLNLDIDKLKKCTQHKKAMGIGLGMVYVFAPMVAYLLSYPLPGALGEAFLAIGASAAAMGAPVVWSNIAKGEGNLALMASALSLLAGFVVIPLLLFGMGVRFPVGVFAIKNLSYLGVPLLIGVISQRFQNFLIDDFRHHFSKVALWLLLLVMGVQFHVLFNQDGVNFLSDLGLAVVLMTGFTVLTFTAGYRFSKKIGIMERKARAIGFVSGSKGIAIALFIASQMSGEAVAYVSIYYFIRQGVSGLIAEYLRHGELKSLTGLVEKLPGLQ